MRLTKLPARQAGLVALCLLAFISFVAAQTLPLVGDAARQAGGPQPAGASASPTPSLQPPVGAPASVPNRPGRRDLARYEKAGPFKVEAGMGGPERDAVLAPARSFLLGRWRARQLAHLVVQSPDADGRLLSSSFYVEPDGFGRWCVVAETASGTATHTFVKEVEVAEDGTPILNPTPEDEPRRTGRRALHLKESPEANSGVVF